MENGFALTNRLDNIGRLSFRPQKTRRLLKWRQGNANEAF